MHKQQTGDMLVDIPAEILHIKYTAAFYYFTGVCGAFPPLSFDVKGTSAF